VTADARTVELKTLIHQGARELRPFIFAAEVSASVSVRTKKLARDLLVFLDEES
jgi:hypothetical protein